MTHTILGLLFTFEKSLKELEVEIQNSFEIFSVIHFW